MKTADAHCAKTNRTVKIIKANSLMGTLNFECVARSPGVSPAG